MPAAYVQSKSLAVDFNLDSTTIAITFDAPVGSGNLIVGSAGADKTITSVTDDKSGVYTIVRQTPSIAADATLGSFYRKNVTDGPVTVTVTFSASALLRTINVHEASGLDTSTPLDKDAGLAQTFPGLATDAITSGSVSTTTNGQYIFSSCYRPNGAPGSPTITAGTSYTLRQDPVVGITVEMGTEDQVQTTAGSVAGTWTTTSDSNFVTHLLTFKAAGAAGGPTLTVGIAEPTIGSSLF